MDLQYFSIPAMKATSSGFTITRLVYKSRCCNRRGTILKYVLFVVAASQSTMSSFLWNGKMA